MKSLVNFRATPIALIFKETIFLVNLFYFNSTTQVTAVVDKEGGYYHCINLKFKLVLTENCL